MKQNETQTKTFTITTSPELMQRIERFFALLHFNSNFGHSGTFGIPLDCDGNEKVKIEPINKELGLQVGLVSGVGYDVEIANDKGYSGLFKDKTNRSHWYTRPGAVLYKDGAFVKTTPSWDDTTLTQDNVK